MKTFHIIMNDGSWSDIKSVDEEHAIQQAIQDAIEIVVGWPMLPSELQNAITVNSSELMEV